MSPLAKTAQGTKTSLNVTHGSARQLAVQEATGPLAQFIALFRLPIFLSTMLAISGLYFVVTAVQYWASQLFIEDFGRAKAEVTSIFILVAGSAPIIGVIVGSAVVDRVGGYDTPAQMSRASCLTVVWGLAAALSGAVAAAIEPRPPESDGAAWRFITVVVSVWFLLLFGGAILPAVTGISMAAVPDSLKKTASSWAQLFYNSVGYSLGAYLPGLAAQYVSLGNAMRGVFLSSTLCLLALACTYALARRSALKRASVDAGLSAHRVPQEMAFSQSNWHPIENS